MPTFLRLKIVNTLQGISLLPKDRFVNTITVNRDNAAGLPTLDDYTKLADAFHKFFGVDGAVTHPLYYMDTEQLALDGHSVKVYSMALGPLAGPPVYTLPYTIARNSPAISSLPSELAGCLSFAADPVAGTPQARRRGRIYIGPLNGRLFQNSGGARPNSDFNTVLRNSGVTLASDIVNGPTAGGWAWVIHSKYSVGNQFAPDGYVTSVSTDDAWDIQRRRGIKPTGRISIDV